jgi:hypothetical protein
MRKVTNNEPLVGITIPHEHVKKKYSGINNTVHIRSSFE